MLRFHNYLFAGNVSGESQAGMILFSAPPPHPVDLQLSPHKVQEHVVMQKAQQPRKAKTFAARVYDPLAWCQHHA